jgi:S-methylmethionine-dependent homocysteine/selenocysteine methylase
LICREAKIMTHVQTRYRSGLPQLQGGLFLTDGGLETTLVFHQGLHLPDFAAFTLFGSLEGEAALRQYYESYADIAKRRNAGLIIESATWRASADWAARLGVTPQALEAVNRKAVQLLENVRSGYDGIPIVIAGCVGPRGDGYIPGNEMTESQAEIYHERQIGAFAGTAADMVTVMTMNYVQEATGIARAAERHKMPVAVSFTVETDGNLPTGQSLRSAIEQVDQATSGYPSYYMINCAHPSHFGHVLPEDEPWAARIIGLRANASRQSHAQLNEASKLDEGNPVELGQDYARLKRRLPHLKVMGGCCGTDHRHIEQIALACQPLFVLRD